MGFLSTKRYLKLMTLLKLSRIFIIIKTSVSARKCNYKLPSGLNYKHTTIANYASSAVNKLDALLTDDARVIIYDHHVFIVQATAI
jgi:hypothetical protein